MTTLFVMVKCDLGKVYAVAREAIDRLEYVTEVHSISGEYDLLVRCSLPEGADVGRFVTEQLQAVAGVRSTLTLIAFNAFT